MSDEMLSDYEHELPNEPAHSVSGILHCLRMLAEEAGELLLPETAQALRVAMTVCSAETAAPYPTASRRKH